MRSFVMVSSLSVLLFYMAACSNSSPPQKESGTDTSSFPPGLVNFAAYESNPVFSGGGAGAWDEVIRERGYILKEEDGYHMWYTGYRKDKHDTLYLGYASSPDGISWKRYEHNPVFNKSWTEDMMVVHSDSLYIMFAEGRGDTAHMLTSTDKIHWNDHGSLKIELKNGQPLPPGPYGTPTVWREEGTWYLFYERNDSAIWLASSKDLNVWRNVQDEPVIDKGPEAYDKYGVALNQVVKHNGKYYGYYHGTAFEDWSEWSTNVAVSADLRTWKKYDANPIMKENKSSGILVHDGSQFRLYTMHPEVCLHFPAGK